MDAIDVAMMKLSDCKLIVVDPIGSFLGGGTDAHRDNEVRGVLAPIAALAEKYGPAVLIVAHRRKSTAGMADDLALGSRAFTGIARAVWHLSRDNKNKSRRLLLPGKNNLAREGDGLAFSIIGEPPRIAWERDPVAMSADDALVDENQGRERKPGPDAEALDAASVWLRSELADDPRLMKELVDEWKNGQGGSERTLKRAKQTLGVAAYRVEVPGPWWWRLSAKNAEPSQGEYLGPLGKNTRNLPLFNPEECKDAKLPESGTLDADHPSETENRVQVTI
ncbi:MAG: AAA family ATPase [Thermoguttaceae bacterium]